MSKKYPAKFQPIIFTTSNDNSTSSVSSSIVPYTDPSLLNESFSKKSRNKNTKLKPLVLTTSANLNGDSAESSQVSEDRNESISVDYSKNYDGADGDNDNKSEEEDDQVGIFASTLSTLWKRVAINPRKIEPLFVKNLLKMCFQSSCVVRVGHVSIRLLVQL